MLGRWAPNSKRIVLIDESGNTGRTARSPKYFVSAATVMECPKEFIRIGSSYEPNTKHQQQPGVLKFTTSIDDIRLNVLSDIDSMADAKIYAVVVDKRNIIQKLQDNTWIVSAERLLNLI